MEECCKMEAEVRGVKTGGKTSVPSEKWHGADWKTELRKVPWEVSQPEMVKLKPWHPPLFWLVHLFSLRFLLFYFFFLLFWYFITVHWASGCRAQALGHVGSILAVHGLRCSTACGIFLDQDQTSVLCIARWIFDHWTTREAPGLYIWI